MVAGVVAAQLLNGDCFDPQAALNVATFLEGHPDNVAPAIMGGLVSSFSDGRDTRSLRFDVADGISFVAIAPPYEVRTADARKVMPESVSTETCVWQVGHAVATVQALQSGDCDLLSAACQDRLHEPFRARLIPDYEPLRRTALAAGAAAFLISGSGSTMLAVCDGDEGARRVANAVNNMVENHIDGLWVRVLGCSLADCPRPSLLHDPHIAVAPEPYGGHFPFRWGREVTPPRRSTTARAWQRAAADRCRASSLWNLSSPRST